MANWRDVQSFVHSNFRAEDLSDGLIKLLFDTGDLRSQVVFVSRSTLAEGEEWVSIQSIVADLAQVDPAVALRATEEMVVGGLSLVGDRLVLRHAAPLLNLDANELLRPLALVTHSADALERRLIGTDEF